MVTFFTRNYSGQEKVEHMIPHAEPPRRKEKHIEKALRALCLCVRNVQTIVDHYIFYEKSIKGLCSRVVIETLTGFAAQMAGIHHFPQ